MNKNWISYWTKKNIWSSSNIWKKNSEIYYNEIKKIFFFKTKINILDIGCGTGELIENLANQTTKVYGADVSDIYIKICKKKFKENNKIIIKKFKNNYKKLYQIDKKFSFIFCNSVVQYFSDENEIIELVKSVKKISNKGTKFLISDIMDIKEKKNLFKFVLYSFLRGYFLILVKQYFILMINPKYRVLEAKYKLLHVDTHKLANKLNPLAKKISVIDIPLTINVNRKHLLVEF
jgi:2-polyprenyl-3-methyl-5-hydroxy-6-metoxy-1,4-benzoquinol methylase